MKRKYLILFSLSGVVVCFDQLLKQLAKVNLSVGEIHPVIPGFLSVGLSKNSGFAFGLLNRAPQSLQNVFFVGVPAFALVLIILIFIKLQDDQFLTSVALTTILGGAVGNLVDRLQYGHVIDFLQFHVLGATFPAFNLADISIVCGVMLLFVSTLRQPRTA